MKIRKGDDIVVLAGKYRRRARPRLEEALPGRDLVVLDSLNIAKRHMKQRGATMQAAGIIDKFMPLHVSQRGAVV
jgi:large subunit ribosomal protein L24